MYKSSKKSLERAGVSFPYNSRTSFEVRSAAARPKLPFLGLVARTVGAWSSQQEGEPWQTIGKHLPLRCCEAEE